MPLVLVTVAVRPPIVTDVTVSVLVKATVITSPAFAKVGVALFDVSLVMLSVGAIVSSV